MSESLRNLAFDVDYSSSTADMISNFLGPALENSASYDRAAGFFSSSLFVLAPGAWADFFLRGSKMQLICSVELSRQDYESLSQSEFQQELDLAAEFFKVWSKFLTQPRGELTGKLMRALIHHSLLEIKVASFGTQRGLFHDKLGVFKDKQGDSISFTGSANESWNAWSGKGNHESVDVFRSWVDADNERVLRHSERFSSYWNSRVDGLSVFEGEEILKVIMNKDPDEDLEKVLQEVRAELETAIPELSSRRGRILTGDRPALRDYQSEAVNNWFQAGCKGVISFATGGGKTVTALEIIRQWSLRGGTALVLVPTSILVSQWIREAEKYLSSPKILRADSSSVSSWKSVIRAFLKSPSSVEPRVVVTTYKSASTLEFAGLVPGHPELLIVGDEVHRFGAEETKNIKERINPGARLGLSATPVRGFDDAGNEAIVSYFGDTLEPVYSLREAIHDKYLVPYKFAYSEARLNQKEQDEWDELSKKISRILAIEKSSKPSSLITQLTTMRARIAKIAEDKISKAARIVAENYVSGDRWLVYCETVEHVNSIKIALRDLLPEVVIMTYTTFNEKDHDRVLLHFTNSGGILLAIRMLDEGVDIPLINKAIIVSSSQSEREFIQRRGRVLRRAQGKYLAELFDFLMLDSQGGVLSENELVRLLHFAEDALNQEPYIKLKSIWDSRKINAQIGGDDD